MAAAAVLALVVLCFPVIIFSTYAFAALNTLRGRFVAIAVGFGLNIVWVFTVGTMTLEEFSLEIWHHLVLFGISFAGSAIVGFLLRMCRRLDTPAVA